MQEGISGEVTTDGRTGLSAAQKYLSGNLPKPEDGYAKTAGPGSTSLQNVPMSKRDHTHVDENDDLED